MDEIEEKIISWLNAQNCQSAFKKYRPDWEEYIHSQCENSWHRHIICDAFVWVLTEEGNEYWEEYSHKLTDFLERICV